LTLGKGIVRFGHSGSSLIACAVCEAGSIRRIALYRLPRGLKASGFATHFGKAEPYRLPS
jgi:hypothetical protein